MNVRARPAMISATLLAAMTATMPVGPALAQMSPTAPVVKPADTVKLTMEQRHTIKEVIIKELKVPPQSESARIPTEVGQKVPSGIPLQPMPVEVAAKIPQIKSHAFLVKGDEVVIVDPKDNKVAALIQ